MFTAIVVSRAIVNLTYGRQRRLDASGHLARGPIHAATYQFCPRERRLPWAPQDRDRVSVVLVLLSVALLATRGLNFGIDFTGGTLVEVGLSAGGGTGSDPRATGRQRLRTCDGDVFRHLARRADPRAAPGRRSGPGRPVERGAAGAADRRARRCRTAARGVRRPGGGRGAARAGRTGDDLRAVRHPDLHRGALRVALRGGRRCSRWCTTS
jgi:hypothetical protein